MFRAIFCKGFTVCKEKLQELKTLREELKKSSQPDDITHKVLFSVLDTLISGLEERVASEKMFNVLSEKCGNLSNANALPGVEELARDIYSEYPKKSYKKDWHLEVGGDGAEA